MNMDEVYQQLLVFEQSLSRFAEALDTTWRDIENRHNQLDPSWDDDFQRRYAALWQPLSDNLNAYRTHSIPLHMDLLKRKIHLAEDYLRGPI